MDFLPFMLLMTQKIVFFKFINHYYFGYLSSTYFYFEDFIKIIIQ